jgi:hypothetical protein
MRDIRARIGLRGIELNNQQIQELAARRLESILDPRSLKPALLDQLKRNAAGIPPLPSSEQTPVFTFEENTLYESHRGILRFIRRLLNPILKLFFNPNPLVRALNAQSQLNTEAAAREVERDRKQTEWNALHYEILQRLVTDVARVSIEMQSLALRVESLGAKVDFNDRRVRTLEGAPYQARTGRIPEAAGAVAPAEGSTGEGSEQPVDSGRRRRRRRRGRRSGMPGFEGSGMQPAASVQPRSETPPADHSATSSTGEPQVMSQVESPPPGESGSAPAARADAAGPSEASTAAEQSSDIASDTFEE